MQRTMIFIEATTNPSGHQLGFLSIATNKKSVKKLLFEQLGSD